MRSLTQIANSYGTDKGTEGPSTHHVVHNYTDVYEAFFSSRRDEPLNFLEIGIGLKRKEDPRIAHGRNESGGASIRMWHDYFPKATIYAIDIVPAAQLDNERIKTFVVDQGDENSLKAFVEKLKGVEFDYIIDDGSHVARHQQLTLGVLFPRLKEGGVYFIEDLRNDGLGDISKGEKITNGPFNTRKVLHAFAETGAFPEPHALADVAYLKDNIKAIDFFVPTQRIDRVAAFKKLFGGKDTVLKFQPSSELLCAIHKR